MVHCVFKPCKDNTFEKLEAKEDLVVYVDEVQVSFVNEVTIFAFDASGVEGEVEELYLEVFKDGDGEVTHCTEDVFGEFVDSVKRGGDEEVSRCFFCLRLQSDAVRCCAPRRPKFAVKSGQLTKTESAGKILVRPW
mmetsp:Transcript_3198/g.4796  ORF Transcript_3198/g.4796 Transcript_3198/m.4796 type:complete len:136 (+) Transcript_3198:649-1056(+)